MMMKVKNDYRNRFCYVLVFFIGIAVLCLIACKQEYLPPAIKVNYNYLVVDGFINATTNGTTTIKLSRTRNLTDTIRMIPESDANVMIEDESGGTLNLIPSGVGSYSNNGPLSLFADRLYRLHIKTQNGSEYVSDYVPVKNTPAIDSLAWKQDGDVTVSVNSHDPQNNSRYYRWDYVETWEYFSPLRGSISQQNGTIYYLDSTNRIDQCWKTQISTNIVIENTVRLSEDKIDHFPVAMIPQGSEKIGHRYSVLVNQYTLTEDAFKYWDILRKNTQQLGSLFDPQPSQLKGNIHCLSNSKENVIGFVSASTVQSKRIFIAHAQVINWIVAPYEEDCRSMIISQGANPFIWDYPDEIYGPYYFITGGLVIAPRVCLECALSGGVTQRPSFW